MTEVLEKARTEWRIVGKEAMDIGSEVHKLLEQHTALRKLNILGAIVSLPLKISNAYEAFRIWEKENVEEWIESERTIVCTEHGYAGTLDAVVRMKNGLKYVIDFKSSKAHYSENSLQIAAYRYAYELEKGVVDGMGILRLDKQTGMPDWKDYTAVYDRKKNAFLHLLRYWYAAKKRKLKGNPFVS
jgi:hypothetical protein